MTPGKRVLVTDFDGTITEHDFYRQAASLLPHDIPDYWREYRSGAITHFEALAAIFRHLKVPEREIMNVARSTRPDPRMKDAVRLLREAGWEIVVVSAGCRWYIDRLLAELQVSLPVHANPGLFDPATGLRMFLPSDSPYFSPTTGIDKEAVVRDLLGTHGHVAFAGDGYPDRPAAGLVADDLRFARGVLGDSLTQDGLPFHPFKTWSDIARRLAAQPDR